MCLCSVTVSLTQLSCMYEGICSSLVNAYVCQLTQWDINKQNPRCFFHAALFYEFIKLSLLLYNLKRGYFSSLSSPSSPPASTTTADATTTATTTTTTTAAANTSATTITTCTTAKYYRCCWYCCYLFISFLFLVLFLFLSSSSSIRKSYFEPVKY